jgi:hypothetical protein
MFMYQLKMKRRISEESIKRAIESWKATIQSRPSSSGRGVKRERVVDEEEEAEEEEERLISMDRKRYTGELHSGSVQRGSDKSERVLLEIVGESRTKPYKRPYKTKYRVRHYLKDRTRGYQTKEEWYSNKYLLILFGPKVVLEKLKTYMPEQYPIDLTGKDGTVGKSSQRIRWTRLIFRTRSQSHGLRKG